MTLIQYQPTRKFIDKIVHTINSQKDDKVDEEHKSLKALPLQRTADYTEKVVRVSTSSIIQVNRVLYTVPSRLIGKTLRVHIYDNRLDVYLGATKTVTLPKVFVTDNNHRARQVDYRHIIKNLERKPQAFRYYSQLRDDILPTADYKAIWAWLDAELEPRKACKMIIGILALAHRADCEKALSDYLLTKISKDVPPSLLDLQRKFAKLEQPAPAVHVDQPPTATYDDLLRTPALGGLQ